MYKDIFLTVTIQQCTVAALVPWLFNISAMCMMSRCGLKQSHMFKPVFRVLHKSFRLLLMHCNVSNMFGGTWNFELLRCVFSDYWKVEVHRTGSVCCWRNIAHWWWYSLLAVNLWPLCWSLIVHLQISGCELTFKRQEEPDAFALCMLEGSAGGSWISS